MNKIDSSNLELIYSFLDGEIEPEAQEQLFSELACNKSLQSEIRNAYHLKNVLMTEYASCEVATELSENLFTKAGINFHKTDKTYKHSAKLMKTMSNSLLSAFIGAFAVIIYFSFINKADNNFSSTYLIKSKNNVPYLVANNQQPTKPITGFIHNSAAIAGVNKNKVTKKNTLRYLSLDTSQTVPSDNDNLLATCKNIKANNYPYTLKESFGVNSINNKNVLSKNYGNQREQSLGKAVLDNRTGQLEYRFSDLWHNLSAELSGTRSLMLFPNRSIDESNGGTLNNISIALKYWISTHQQIGVEYGRESFPIFVKDKDVFSLRNSISWFGAVYQYNFDYIFSEINPYCKIFTGGNSSGPVLKTDFGLSWLPDEAVKFNFAFTGTELIYRKDKAWYNTQKLGFKYGVEIRFK